jgi:hypothetical protein
MAHGGGVLRVLVLCLDLPFVYGKGKGGGDIARPGDNNYWVLLGGMYSMDGQFEEPFFPSGEDFTVNVNDIHQKSHDLYFQIQSGKYVEGGTPDIYVDGEMLEDYDPGKPIKVTTKLDDGIDAVEKTIEIKVGDPKNIAGLFLKQREHIYRVLLKQPPEYDLVVQAENINLTDVDGHHISPDQHFVATSPLSSYKYKLLEGDKCKDDSCIVQLKVRCSSVATGLKIDGEDFGNDEAYEIDMSNEILKRVSAMCRYENTKWTPSPRERYYEIVLEREVTFEGEVSIMMLGLEGVCEKVLTDGTKSFECRTRVQKPRLTFYSSEHQAHLALIDNQADTELRIQNGIPMPLKLPEDEDNFQFKLRYGKEEHIYPLRLFKPAMCTKKNLKCPEGQGMHTASQSAIEHMCHSKKCSTEVDAPLCCGDRDTCDHYPGGCKRHTCLRFDAADALCEETVCHASDIDQEICCAPLARCNTYSPAPQRDADPPPGCHRHEALRHDSADIECARDVCDLQVDHDVCCRPKAMCDTYDFPCPEGKALSLDARNLECLLDVCTKDDHVACCAPKARCDTFTGTCPAFKVLRHDAADVMCKECGCVQEDDNVCCQPISNCTTYHGSCPDGMVKRLDAAGVPCARDVCTEEADQEACCQAKCGRFDPAMCPDNEVVRHDGGYICNHGVGDECTAHECCHLRAMCTEFRFDCPNGTHRRHDAFYVECAGDECHQEDEDVCCLPRAKCSTFPATHCLPGMVPGRQQKDELCFTDLCGVDMHDALQCCTKAATCAQFNFTCPEPLVIKTNLESLDCVGEFCVQEDEETCCGPVAHCSTLDCIDRAVREDIDARCKAFECTEKDLDHCCAERPNCSEFNFSCATGTTLAYRASERKCRGHFCHPEDTSMCCLARQSCKMFKGSCPEGSSIYMEGLCQQEKCTDDDMELCCIVDQTILEGLLRISNIDFRRLAGLPPVSTSPASTTPASTTPASTTPASTTPASTTPASSTPASTTEPTIQLTTLSSRRLANKEQDKNITKRPAKNFFEKGKNKTNDKNSSSAGSSRSTLDLDESGDIDNTNENSSSVDEISSSANGDEQPLTLKLAELVCDQLVVEDFECEGVVAADHDGGSVQVMFKIDASGADQPFITVQKERLKNKDAIAYSLNAALDGEMRNCKTTMEDPLGIPFLALAEGQVDLTHGGIYYPAMLGAQDEDGQWTVQLAWGESMMGVSPHLLHHFYKSNSDDYAEGDWVRVLVALAKAAVWEERGISRELAFRIAAEREAKTHALTRLPPAVFVMLIIFAAGLAVMWWATGYLVWTDWCRWNWNPSSPQTASSDALLADDAAEETLRQRVAQTLCPGGARQPPLNSPQGKSSSGHTSPETAPSDALPADDAATDTAMPPGGLHAPSEQVLADDAAQE